MKKWTSLNKTCVVGPARCRDSHGPSYLLINGLSSALVMVEMVMVVDTLAASCQPWLRLHGNMLLCDGLQPEKESVKFIKTRNHLCFWANNLWSLGWLYVLAKPVQPLPVPFFHPQGSKHIITTVFSETSSIKTIPQSPDYPCCLLLVTIRLCSWLRSPFIENESTFET